MRLSPARDGIETPGSSAWAMPASSQRSVEELAALARRPGWVTEEPEVHLVPPLRGADVEGVRLFDSGTGMMACWTPMPTTVPVSAAAILDGWRGR